MRSDNNTNYVFAWVLASAAFIALLLLSIAASGQMEAERRDKVQQRINCWNTPLATPECNALTDAKGDEFP